MRSLAIALVCLAAACNSAYEQKPSYGLEFPLTGEFPHEIPPVAYQAAAWEGRGARLYEVVAVVWRDGCLEVHRKGYLCTLGTVPGYRVIVENDGWLIAYHTGRERGFIRAGAIGPIAELEPVAAMR